MTRLTVAYSFPFHFEGRRGRVEVHPAGAFVTFGGIGAQIEAWRGPILVAIFHARLAYANIDRNHTIDCFCLRCRNARVTPSNPHGFYPDDPDIPSEFERAYNAGEWEPEKD